MLNGRARRTTSYRNWRRAKPAPAWRRCVERGRVRASRWLRVGAPVPATSRSVHAPVGRPPAFRQHAHAARRARARRGSAGPTRLEPEATAERPRAAPRAASPPARAGPTRAALVATNGEADGGFLSRRAILCAGLRGRSDRNRRSAPAHARRARRCRMGWPAAARRRAAQDTALAERRRRTPLPPGLSDQLAAVEAELTQATRSPYTALGLVDELDLWPGRWRRVLQRLQCAGTRLDPAIEQARVRGLGPGT